MKLTKIDTVQAEAPAEKDAGLKVKSHVKAGVGTVAAVTLPRLQPIANLGARPIYVCG